MEKKAKQIGISILMGGKRLPTLGTGSLRFRAKNGENDIDLGRLGPISP